MSISGKSDDGNNQTMNSINAMNGVMNDGNGSVSAPGSVSGKQQNGSSQPQQNVSQQQQGGEGATPKPVIERGASWSYNETRILLSLWGQDMVQRQLTNSKRTRHVWVKIAEKIGEFGFQRTAGNCSFCLSASQALTLGRSVDPNTHICSIHSTDNLVY